MKEVSRFKLGHCLGFAFNKKLEHFWINWVEPNLLSLAENN